MCTTAYYVHPRCGCRWLRITRPCGPGRGFSTCPDLLDGTARLPPRTYRARLPGFVHVRRRVGDERVTTVERVAPPPSSACPLHNLGGCYDRNEIRRVLAVQNGLRWGAGPNREDYGVEWNCRVM